MSSNLFREKKCPRCESSKVYPRNYSEKSRVSHGHLCRCKNCGKVSVFTTTGKIWTRKKPPEIDAQIIELKLTKGMTYKKIGERLRCSASYVGTVFRKYYRGLK